MELQICIYEVTLAVVTMLIELVARWITMTIVNLKMNRKFNVIMKLASHAKNYAYYATIMLDAFRA